MIYHGGGGRHKDRFDLHLDLIRNGSFKAVASFVIIACSTYHQARRSQGRKAMYGERVYVRMCVRTLYVCVIRPGNCMEDAPCAHLTR